MLPGEGRDGLMQKFTSLVGALPKKAIAELMVHPAFADEVLLQSSSYNLQRVQEHSVLTDPLCRAVSARARHRTCKL